MVLKFIRTFFVIIFFKTSMAAETTQSFDFLGLPDDLQLIILNSALPKDRLHLGSTCRHLRQLHTENFAISVDSVLDDERANGFFGLLNQDDRPYYKDMRMCLCMDESQLNLNRGALFKKLEKLEELVMNNNVDPNHMANLLESISHPLRLKRLSMESKYDASRGNGIERLCNSLSRLSKLEYFKLSLSWDPEIDNGFENVLRALSKMSNLRAVHLYLWDNAISSMHIQELARVISGLNQLEFLGLYFSQNSVEDEGAKALVSSLVTCPTLLEFSLDLSDNNLTAEGAKEISDYLTQMQQPELLRLGLEGNEGIDPLTFIVIKQKLRSAFPATTVLFLERLTLPL